MELPVVDPRVSRTGRWLRERRLRLAVWIAVIEGLLVIFDVIPGWFALLVGAIVVLFYVMVGRGAGDTLAQASWTAAMSQVLVALVPIAAFVLTTLAVVVLAVIALLALALLLGDRR